jgi:hypothetical protein
MRFIIVSVEWVPARGRALAEWVPVLSWVAPEALGPALSWL